MTDPAVAVVIPCHNAARWIEAALRSVLAQSRPVAEIVVVDDGSTDDSAELVERLGVRCVRQACGGPAAARNRGVRETTAPLVAFLDADDCFDPRKLERQVEVLERTGAVASCTDAWLLREGGRAGRKNIGRGVPAQLGFTELILGNPIICSSVVGRRQALEQAGLFDEDPVLVATEDYDLWLRLLRQGSFAYLDEPLLDYRVTASSLSDDERFVRGVDRIMAKCRDTWSDVPELDALIAQRRAAVRVDSAYHLANEGRGREARDRLAEVRRLGGFNLACLKIWLRSWRAGGDVR